MHAWELVRIIDSLLGRIVLGATFVLAAFIFAVVVIHLDLFPNHGATLAVPVPTVSVTPAHRMTCRDFQTQADAQAYFESHYAPWLDANRDGRACQRLP